MYDKPALRGQVRQLLNDGSPVFWTDTEIGDWIDQAVVDISTKGRCVEHVFVLPLQTASQAYPLTISQPYVIGIEAVTNADDGAALAQLRTRQFGHVSTGTDMRPSSYAFFANTLLFFPVPKTPHTVFVWCWVWTTILELLPDGYENLVILYTLMKARLKEQRYAEAAQLNNMYLAELQFQRNDLQDREPDSKEKLRLADRIVHNG
jgi:hypothetical protein